MVKTDIVTAKTLDLISETIKPNLTRDIFVPMSVISK